MTSSFVQKLRDRLQKRRTEEVESYWEILRALAAEGLDEGREAELLDKLDAAAAELGKNSAAIESDAKLLAQLREVDARVAVEPEANAELASANKFSKDSLARAEQLEEEAKKLRGDAEQRLRLARGKVDGVRAARSERQNLWRQLGDAGLSDAREQLHGEQAARVRKEREESLASVNAQLTELRATNPAATASIDDLEKKRAELTKLLRPVAAAAT